MTTPPRRPDDDDGLIDDLGDVVDVVLGDHLPEPAAEDPWQRRERVIDALTATVLAMAAVATAWATFQSTQWGSEETDARSRATTARAGAIRSATSAEATEEVDTSTWLLWLGATAEADKRRARALRERFRPTLEAAQAAWIETADEGVSPAIDELPPGTPFTRPEYRVPARDRADELEAQAEQELTDAQRASSNSTRYVSDALILALVLFFAGIATKFRNPKMQALLVALAIGFTVFGLARLIAAPVIL